MGSSLAGRDHFGVVAQLIEQVSIAGQKIVLKAGAFNDVVNPPGTNDFTIREIGGLVRQFSPG